MTYTGDRNRWGGPSPWAGKDSRTDAQKNAPWEVSHGGELVFSTDKWETIGPAIAKIMELMTLEIPSHWENDIPVTVEERLRIALVRLAGCTCGLPLLGYTGGKETDGPRCRLCNCGIKFTEVTDK